jgi:predicted ATPase
MHEGSTFQEMAEKVYQNKQRTSTSNGFLKAEAAYHFARVVQKFDVEYLQDVNKILGDEKFETDIARIPGQGSGDSGTGKAFDPLACKRFPMLK